MFRASHLRIESRFAEQEFRRIGRASAEKRRDDVLLNEGFSAVGRSGHYEPVSGPGLAFAQRFHTDFQPGEKPSRLIFVGRGEQTRKDSAEQWPLAFSRLDQTRRTGDENTPPLRVTHTDALPRDRPGEIHIPLPPKMAHHEIGLAERLAHSFRRILAATVNTFDAQLALHVFFAQRKHGQRLVSNRKKAIFAIEPPRIQFLHDRLRIILARRWCRRFILRGLNRGGLAFRGFAGVPVAGFFRCGHGQKVISIESSGSDSKSSAEIRARSFRSATGDPSLCVRPERSNVVTDAPVSESCASHFAAAS